MRLAACHACHTQYDVSAATVARFACACGADVETVPQTAVDAAIRRCGSCGAGLEPEAEACAYCRSAVVRDPGRLGLVCPECYARNAEASRFCTGCGVEFRPQAMPAAAAVLACPDCKQDMTLRSVAGTLVQQCAACNGLWAPNDSFDTLVKRTAEAARREPTSGLGARATTPRPIETRVAYRPCPVCHKQMVRRNFGRTSGVIVDWCGRHGTWLDADELEHIARYVMAGGLDASASAEAAQTITSRAESLLALERILEEERSRRRQPPGDLLSFLWKMLE